MCYRSADKVAVPSIHYLRTEDMPGREALRAGLVFWPSTSLPTGRLLQKATRSYFSSILSGALPWRARIPMQVRSNWCKPHNTNGCSQAMPGIATSDDIYIQAVRWDTKLQAAWQTCNNACYTMRNLQPNPRSEKGLYGMQEKKTALLILVHGLMAYSKGACEWPVPSSVGCSSLATARFITQFQ